MGTVPGSEGDVRQVGRFLENWAGDRCWGHRTWIGMSWGSQRAGQGLQAPHHVLIVEQVHYACCPLAHGHQVRGRLVESKQAQGCTLLHTVHAVSVGTAHGSQASLDPVHPTSYCCHVFRTGHRQAE